MRVAAFPADAPFLPALARAWLAAPGDSTEGLLILPSRRSARALAGAFLQANQSKALLLPRIIALGAVDEAGLTITEQLNLPPAVPALTRQTMLAKLILARHGKNGAPTKISSAWSLAADLAALLDEADLAEINLADTLPHLVGGELASHWQTTLEFLNIVTHAWPAILNEMGMINPVHRQNLLMDAQNAAWQRTPPHAKIWLVARAANPALQRLAKTIAELPAGAIICPGYDTNMATAGWEAVGDTHPQKSIAALLISLGVRQEEIQIWPSIASKVPAGRSALISKALLPASCLPDWQTPDTAKPDGLYKLVTRDEHEESRAIALALRDAMEQPDLTAALITPDRNLAQRVTANLRRFGIIADDSAGETLADTPPATFLRLLARAVADDFAPLPLLALLKHPLTANQQAPEICRENARQLEIAALRGPRPGAGFDGIKFRLQGEKHKTERDFLERLELNLAPVINLPLANNPAEALRALIETAENLATSDVETGASRLWTGEAGQGLSELLIEIFNAVAPLPDIPPDELGKFLDVILLGHVVRRPRTKDGHPRVAIWGIQEANLQSVDLAVLAGLVEGVWPSIAEPGPWMSRPMRSKAGLPAAEQEIGLSANDFFSLCCQTPTVILSVPKRRERAPAVPARWITRLDALLHGIASPMTLHDAAGWAAQIDMPEERLLRPRPRPKPPAEKRPTKLSITDIATLITDPYSIYIGKILRIKQLDELDEESDAGLFGNIVHDGLEEFFSTNPDFLSPDAPRQLNSALQIAMRAGRPRPALEHWWAARLQRIAHWVVETELERRLKWGAPSHLALEIEAELNIPPNFTLTGRADRIERRADGSVFILDYKTGTAPDGKKLQSGAAPQLPLEAVMAEAGAFGPDFLGIVTELAVWKLSGRRVEGEDKALIRDPELLRAIIEQADKKLPVLFKKFAKQSTPYLAMPHPDRVLGHDNFQDISRRSEWINDE